MATRKTPSSARPAPRRPAPEKTTGKKPVASAPATAAAQNPARSNRPFILGAIAVILLLAALQFLLLLTVADEKLKPLDKGSEVRIQVVRVLDLDFPFLSDAEFAVFLEQLQNVAREKLGFRITLEATRNILNDDFLSPGDLFADRQAADTWFRSQLAVSKGWQTNYAWLNAILQQPAARAILAGHYRTSEPSDLEAKIRRDFAKRISGNLAIRDVRGRRIFDDPRRQALSSTAYWSYLLGKQAEGDFIVCNIPIFFPSALTPPDAVSRGGMVTTLLTASSRQFGGAIALSTFPVIGRRQYSRDNARTILVELGVQALGRLLYRRGYDAKDTGSLLFPALGDDLLSWYNKGSRKLDKESAQTIKRF